jgi:zinc protease
MPGLRLSAAILGLCAALGAPALADPAPDPTAGARLTTLDNGLRILTLEERTTPVVSFQVWVDVGSGDEARWSGLAHLFEHMMFRGSEHVSGEERDRLLQRAGSQGNAYTSKDVTVYFEDVSSESLPLVIDLEAERLRYLVISPEVLDTEREVVLEERRFRSEDNPQGRLTDALLALSFAAHPYRVPTIGWRSDVEKVGVEPCRQFFHSYYVPNNLVISIAGDFDADAAIARIRRTIGAIPRAPEPPRNPTTEPPQDGERRAVIEMPVRGPLVGAAWHAPPSGDPDGDALDVLSAILSAGFSSRLHRRLVYKEQQALSAFGGYWELRRAGLFYAAASVRPGRDVDRVEALLTEEIERLREELASDEEIERARRQLEVGLVAGLGSNHALASHMAEELLTFGRIRPLEERLAAIDAVGAADVRRVARTWLKPEGRSVVQVVARPEEAHE